MAGDTIIQAVDRVTVARQRGSALAEAAVVMPILVPLLLGTMELSWYFHKQQLVESGVRDAARYMARTTAANSDANPCNNATF